MSAFSNTIDLIEADWQRLVSRLDLIAKCEHDTIIRVRGDLRCEPRMIFRRSGLPMVVMNDGRPAQRMIVCSRNLSSGGIGLLHGQYLHIGTSIEMYLPRLDGKWVRQFGMVAFCRHLTCQLHEAGVQFNGPISLEAFIKEGTLMIDGEMSDIDLKNRKILMLQKERDESDVAALLKQAGATIFDSKCLEEAVSLLCGQNMDFVIIDYDLGRGYPESLIARLRAERYPGPLAVFGVRGNPDTCSQARNWQVDMVFHEELSPALLVEGVAWVLQCHAINSEVSRDRTEMTGPATR